MFLRTEGDLVRAANQAQDLTNLVMQYLELWKKHANGRSGVRIPENAYCVIFTKQITAGGISFKIIFTETTYREEPVYYDTDSDYFNEAGFGSGNLSHYEKHIEYSQREQCLSIPLSCLMLPPDKMEQKIKDFVTHDTARIKEANRVKDIADLEAKLAKLRSEAAS